MDKLTFDDETTIADIKIENSNLDNQDLDDFEDTKEPHCPKCGSKMVLRTAKKGKYSGQKFWGCSKFPICDGILNV